MLCDARDRESSKKVFVTLVQHVMTIGALTFAAAGVQLGNAL